MRKLNPLFLAAPALVVFAFPGNAQVVNGEFDGLSGWTQDAVPAPWVIEDTRISTNNGFGGSTPGLASHGPGTGMVALQTGNNGGRISQDVATTPGEFYELSFWHNNLDHSGTQGSGLQSVTWSVGDIGSEIVSPTSFAYADHVGTGHITHGWTQERKVFEAVAPTTRIAFEGTPNSTGGYWGIQLDSVTLNPTVLASISGAPAGVITNATEAGTYTQVYELPIGNTPDYDAIGGGVPYTIDNSAEIRDGSFDRLAYYLELDDGSGPEFVWVSMDNFTDDTRLTGVPTFASGAIFEDLVDNMNIISNVSGLTTGTGITTGNIEFWPHNYTGTANSGIAGGTNSYDFDDTRRTTGSYGSMQVHNHGAGTGETVFAFNRWNDGGGSDLGIGNASSGNLDYTLGTREGPSYTLKNLLVFAEIAGANLTTSLPGGSTIEFGLNAGVNANPLTLDDALSFLSDGADNSRVAIESYTLTGPDASFFELVGFTPGTFALQSLESGFLDTSIFDLNYLGGAPGGRSAVLTFQTSEGPVSYNLIVTIPEPSRAFLLLCGLGAVLLRRRR